jgi:hypothetical protein
MFKRIKDKKTITTLEKHPAQMHSSEPSPPVFHPKVLNAAKQHIASERHPKPPRESVSESVNHIRESSGQSTLALAICFSRSSPEQRAIWIARRINRDRKHRIRQPLAALRVLLCDDRAYIREY